MFIIMTLSPTLFLWSRMLRNPLLEMTGDTRISSTSGVKTALRLALTSGEAPEPRRPGELLLLEAGTVIPLVVSRPGGRLSKMSDLGRCGSPGDRSLLAEGRRKVVPLRRDVNLAFLFLWLVLWTEPVGAMRYKSTTKPRVSEWNSPFDVKKMLYNN